ncbi:MAG: hypothetical protein HYS81_01875 [Candidatus Aenigmatarchaeota archaeon]|nr:MAG: hypothetical protein HYS81_01875 [Candidatus Aenigmarchaeota archaeon]
MANRTRATFTLGVKTVARLREASAIAGLPMSQLCEQAILEKARSLLKNGNGQKQCNGSSSPIVCLIVAILKKFLGIPEQNGNKNGAGNGANN